MRYAIVIEKVESNYSAYAPDLPGCISISLACGKADSLFRSH